MSNAGGSATWRLKVAQILLLLGLAIGLKSWWMTLQHVGNQTYLLVPEFTKGATHAWYHAFREAVGDVAAMTVFLWLFFGSPKRRTSTTWWISLILMLGYYAPFWIGTPFLAELAAPHLTAELTHVGMALPPMLALAIARADFFAIR